MRSQSKGHVQRSTGEYTIAANSGASASVFFLPPVPYRLLVYLVYSSLLKLTSDFRSLIDWEQRYASLNNPK